MERGGLPIGGLLLSAADGVVEQLAVCGVVEVVIAFSGGEELRIIGSWYGTLLT